MYVLFLYAHACSNNMQRPNLRSHIGTYTHIEHTYRDALCVGTYTHIEHIMHRDALSRRSQVFIGQRDAADIRDSGDGHVDGDDLEIGGSDSDFESSSADEKPRVDIVRSTLKDRVRLATIDNFQGEESQVVILSLVRNNPDGRIGFLKTPNRINGE
jgi:hypothetical protein